MGVVKITNGASTDASSGAAYTDGLAPVNGDRLDCQHPLVHPAGWTMQWGDGSLLTTISDSNVAMNIRATGKYLIRGGGHCIAMGGVWIRGATNNFYNVTDTLGYTLQDALQIEAGGEFELNDNGTGKAFTVQSADNVPGYRRMRGDNAKITVVGSACYLTLWNYYFVGCKFTGGGPVASGTGFIQANASATFTGVGNQPYFVNNTLIGCGAIYHFQMGPNFGFTFQGNTWVNPRGTIGNSFDIQLDGTTDPAAGVTRIIDNNKGYLGMILTFTTPTASDNGLVITNNKFQRIYKNFTTKLCKTWKGNTWTINQQVGKPGGSTLVEDDLIFIYGIDNPKVINASNGALPLVKHYNCIFSPEDANAKLVTDTGEFCQMGGPTNGQVETRGDETTCTEFDHCVFGVTKDGTTLRYTESAYHQQSQVVASAGTRYVGFIRHRHCSGGLGPASFGQAHINQNGSFYTIGYDWVHVENGVYLGLYATATNTTTAFNNVTSGAQVTGFIGLRNSTTNSSTIAPIFLDTFIPSKFLGNCFYNFAASAILDDPPVGSAYAQGFHSQTSDPNASQTLTMNNFFIDPYFGRSADPIANNFFGAKPGKRRLESLYLHCGGTDNGLTTNLDNAWKALIAEDLSTSNQWFTSGAHSWYLNGCNATACRTWIREDWMLWNPILINAGTDGLTPGAVGMHPNASAGTGGTPISPSTANPNISMYYIRRWRR